MMLRHVLALIVAGSIAVPALAQVQPAGDTGRVPARVRSVTLEGSETCPKAQGDEVVVCSRLNPDDQFRIPKELRNTAEPAAKNQAWANRVATAATAGRIAAGLPDTCSTVGSGGQTGCALMMNNAWAAERRAAERNDTMIPGGR